MACIGCGGLAPLHLAAEASCAWPWLPVPADMGAVTVVDVAGAAADADVDGLR